MFRYDVGVEEIVEDVDVRRGGRPPRRSGKRPTSCWGGRVRRRLGVQAPLVTADRQTDRQTHRGEFTDLSGDLKNTRSFRTPPFSSLPLSRRRLPPRTYLAIKSIDLRLRTRGERVKNAATSRLYPAQIPPSKFWNTQNDASPMSGGNPNGSDQLYYTGSEHRPVVRRRGRARIRDRVPFRPSSAHPSSAALRPSSAHPSVSSPFFSRPPSHRRQTSSRSRSTCPGSSRRPATPFSPSRQTSPSRGWKSPGPPSCLKRR